jgi:hypothetical protein
LNSRVFTHPALQTPHAGRPAHTLDPRLQNQTHIHCVPRGLHTTTSYLTPAILRPGLSWLGDKSSNCTSLKPRVLQLWVFPQPSRCAKILWNRSQHADGRNRHQRLSRGVEPELQSLRASRRGRRHAACRACLTPAGPELASETSSTAADH